MTFPPKDNSPVIATCYFIGFLKTKESKADAIVTPAEGPSLGTAPSGA